VTDPLDRAREDIATAKDAIDDAGRELDEAAGGVGRDEQTRSGGVDMSQGGGAAGGGTTSD
jgi:hypothetical protein